MIIVLRYGHRRDRDKRVTTHCALVSRAFGADEMAIYGEEDDQIIKSIKKVVEKWGGNFKCYFIKDWKKFLKGKKKEGFKLVHLTMYGINIDDIIEKIKEDYRKNRKLIIIVGSEKVPKEFYEIADYNVAIGNQPHSEIAALAIFLDRLFEGKELKKEFENWKLKIIPCERGKNVKKRED